MSMILLIALLAPVGVMALANLSLYLSGERGTLLLPAKSGYPATAMDRMPVAKAPVTPEMPHEETEFEEELRLAA